MKRFAITLVALTVLAAAAGARAHEPSVDCSVLSCVSAHGQADVGCGADGRDPLLCRGELVYQVGFDSPLPIESMNYSIDVSCSIPCTGSGLTTGTCGWAPVEVRPIGETGCELGGVIIVSFTADVGQGGCQTYSTTIALEVRTVLDPLPQTAQTTSDSAEVCNTG